MELYINNIFVTYYGEDDVWSVNQGSHQAYLGYSMTCYRTDGEWIFDYYTINERVY